MGTCVDARRARRSASPGLVAPARRSALALTTLLVVLLAADGAARAGSLCPPMHGGDAALASAEASDRLAFIQDGLRRDARNMRLWAWTWAGLYSGSAAAHALRIPLSAPEDRKDAVVATTGSLIGVAALAFMPQKVLSDQPALDRLLEAAPVPGDSCALVAEAERLLLRDAQAEEFGRGPLIHGGNFVLNLALALVTSLAFQHGVVAAISLIVGVVVGEIQIATQPTGSVTLLERYRAGDLGRARLPMGDGSTAGAVAFGF